MAETADDDGCRPVAAQLGTDLKTSAENAVLLDGVSGHSLDYDDVSASIEGYSSVVVFPAAPAYPWAADRNG